MASSFLTDKRLEEASMAYIESKPEIIHCDTFKLIAKVPQNEFQKMGMDAVALVNGEIKTVDFKCMAGLLNTFSQELINITSGRLGWLLNNELKTDYYIYVYHVLQAEFSTGFYGYDKKIITPQNIKYTKAILIPKQKVLEIIEKDLNLPIHEVKDMIFDEIIPEYEKTQRTRFYYHPQNNQIRFSKSNHTSQCYFVISNKIHEQPLNIIVPRKLLEENATKIWEITEPEGEFPEAFQKNL